MRNLILSLIVLLLCAGTMRGATAEPDFAYPQTVISDARKHMQQAGDKGPDAALAMLEITVATMAIDNDSVFLLPAEIHTLAEKQTSPALKSLLLLMEAQTYRAIYYNNRWKYDRTDTPDEPYPADVATWNGRQFTARTNALTMQAYDLACTDPAPLDDYSKLITADRMALRFYPAVRDFVALKALDLLSYTDPTEKKFAINSIIEKEISLCPTGSYGQINWLCTQIDRAELKTDILKLYNQYSSYEAGRELLLKYAREFSCDNVDAATIALLRQSLTDFPEYYNNNAIKNRLTELLQPWIRFNAPATAIPGRPFEIEVTYGNINCNAGIVVQRGKDNSSQSYSKPDKNSPQVARFTLTTNDKLPYKSTVKFSYTPDKEVYYYVSAFIDAPKYKKSEMMNVLATSLTPIEINFCTENAVIVADAASGMPVQNVKVSLKDRSTRNPQPALSIGKTDDEGTLRFRLSKMHNYSSGRTLSLTYRNKVYDFGGRINVFSSRVNYSDRDEHKALLFTDRALYHHGDSINWALAVSRRNRLRNQATVAADMKVKVSLFNANSERVIDTIVTTDNFGRATGFFILPENILSGRFSLQATNSENRNSLGATTVEVSDFKLPQFDVRIDSILRDYPHRGWVTVKGVAETYSLMPVVDAQVQAEVRSASRMRWFEPEETLGHLSSTTDTDGRFTLEFSDSLLSKTSLDCYVAYVSVTASDGESHNTDTQFTTGRPYGIIFFDKWKFNTADSLVLPVYVYDASGVERKPELRWALLDDKVEIAKGTATGKYNVDWSNIPSGDYTLKVWTADTLLADSCSDKVSLYNTKYGTMSNANPVFIPENNLDFTHGQIGELLYGVPEDTYLYMTLAADSLLVSVEGIQTKAGFHHLKVTLPEGYESGRLTFYAIKDGTVYSENVYIHEKVDRTIKIEGESFRDHLAPGDVERWRLKLRSPESTKHLPAAMIATAYNKAIDAISSYWYWPRSFYYFHDSGTSISSLTYNDFTRSIFFNPTGLKLLKEVIAERPEFKYSSSFYIPITVRGYGSVRMYKNAAVATQMAVADSEEEAEASPRFAEALSGSVSGLMSAAEEAKDANDESADVDHLVQTVYGISKDALATYRPSEVLQALWQPSLVSDKDGNVEISFTVPQANTTWQFRTFAWDERLNTGTFVRDVVSQKPVMVQPNLPRFLRAGDSGTVLASVFNNSEDGDSIVTVAEIFDPATGRILSASRTATFVKPNGSAVISLPVEAPADASLIGYRVRATLDKFTDGEQSLIPVLSASTEVIESQIFSMTANTAETTVKLPAADKMQTVLEFCSNPAWDVIKALPSLYESKASTSYSDARQLFRAAAGRSIVKSDPQIEPTLRRALSNPQDSSLVSQLEKNDQLKIATLQQTPWVQAAASQTARMARLELLLDPRLVAASQNQAITLLGKFRNADGGFRWGEWSDESSEWATYNVLHTLGRLNIIGALPADGNLQSMISPALNYLDSQLKERKTDFDLAWLYTLLPDCKPALKSQKVIAATVQQLLEGWRTMSVGLKARTAMILKHNGYPKVAGEILSSIAQFAQTDKDGSMFFPSVDDIDQYAAVLLAFAALEPDSQLVDGVRQWLVMRSQRTDALGSCDPTDVIAAFMRSGSRWTVPATIPQIRLGDKLLQLPEAESMTGHFTMTIDNSGNARKLTVSRTSPQTPAWGALLSRYTGRTDQIKPHSSSKISVEKELSVLRDGKWQYAKEVRLGERVRVVLTVKTADDLQFVTISDDRAAGLEPVDQLPGYVSSAGVSFYRENSDSATRLFIGWLPRGTYSISYELTASMAGDFISGVATVQSQYAPSVTAHSGGYRLTIE